ncbi:ThuA domain-containing protein [Gaoshiqia sp. Z1-71]|uniref:ThuA domain-containing protein n=1 Tax=Gaoshiqia hydrogeniformans TaxID=3290090 RepID=UPI003BF8FF6F
MKSLFFIFSLLAMVSSGYSGNLKVLIVTGGHSFERAPFFELFGSIDGISWVEAVQPKANQMMLSGEADEFDVLVFYDMYQEISDEEKAAFLGLLKSGKPVLFLHHALVSYQQWDEFEQIIGGRYYDETRYPGHPANGYSTYQHDTSVPVRVLIDEHPVTKGLTDFVLFDEVYGNLMILPSVKPLLQTTHPGSAPFIAWENSYEASTIIYIQPGHDQQSYRDENFRRLIKQAIFYLAAK